MCKDAGPTPWLTIRPIRRILVLCLLGICGAMGACRSGNTEDPNSPAVTLRDDLRALAIGQLTEVTGKTLPNECFVLLFGYQGSIDGLPLSEQLRGKLESLTPRDYERFVLVRILNDEITERTEWEAKDDPQFTRVPFLIRGQPFRITIEHREPH